MNNAADARLAIGGNNPPTDAEILAERMRTIYKHELQRAEELAALAETLIPEEINDDETAGRIADFIKQLQSANKAIEAARKLEKDEFVAKGRLVDGFFKKFQETLEKAKERAARPAGEYKDRKDAELRRQREAEAARQREESEAKLREAQRQQREAEEARARAEAERARQEEESRKERERIQREADEKVRLEREEKDRIQREADERNRQQQEQIAKMKAESDKKDADAKAEIAELERKRKEENEAARQAAREAEERAKEAEREKREQERLLRDQERAAEEAARLAEREARQLDRDSNKLLDEAVRHDKAGQKMDAAALGANNRIRGDEGALITTRKVWLGQMTDRATLDLEKLRQHIPEDALHRAVQSFVDAGGRSLPGTHIYEDTQTQVR